MSKILELVMISVLLVFAFFFGVAYSGPVRENFNWLFEVKEQEVSIPEIRKEHDIAKSIKIEETTSRESGQEIINTTLDNNSDENHQIDQNLN